MPLDSSLLAATFGDGALGDIIRPVVTVALGTVVSAVLLKMARRPRQIAHFLDDVMGEEGRPGIPPRPGLMERMATVETNSNEAHVAAQEAKAHAQAAKDAVEKSTLAVAAISAQLVVVVNAVSTLQTNGGKSMRDAIDRIEKDTAGASGRPIPKPALFDHHTHL